MHENSNIFGELEDKIENTLDGYSGALMGSFGQTSFK
jgi:hypothetical protein